MNQPRARRMAHLLRELAAELEAMAQDDAPEELATLPAEPAPRAAVPTERLKMDEWERWSVVADKVEEHDAEAAHLMRALMHEVTKHRDETVDDLRNKAAADGWGMARRRRPWSGYPCTIIPTRYGGSYEGGSWAAFPCHPEAIPWQVSGGDPDAWEWWDSCESNYVGRGASPEEALTDLKRRLAAVPLDDGEEKEG